MSTTVHPSEVKNGITTSWLPLTTPGVSAPPECSSEIYRVPGGQDLMAFDPFYAKNIPNALQCLPLEVTRSWEQTGVTTVTSLGDFRCPSLYTRAATASLNRMSTIIACCPMLYTYRSDNKCISTVPAGQAVVVKNLSGNKVARQANTNGGAITVTGFLVSGYSFADDAALLIATTTPIIPLPTIATSNPETSALVSNSSPGSVPQNPSSALATSTAIPSAPPATSPTSSSDLPVGAKVGITIGAVLTVIIIICLLVSLHIRRRRRTHPLYRDSDHPETGILETSRESRSIKSNDAEKNKHASTQPLPTTQYPGSDGLQTVLAPEVHEQRAREVRAQSEKRMTGTRTLHSSNSTGPHEMDTHATVKLEMDAGSLKIPTRASELRRISTSNLSRTKSQSRSEFITPSYSSSPTIPTQARELRRISTNNFSLTKPRTPTRSEKKTPSFSSSPTLPTSMFTASSPTVPTSLFATSSRHSQLTSHSQTTSRTTLRDAPLSLSPVSRDESPDLIVQSNRDIHTPTPVSSFERTAPTVGNRGASRNASLNEVRHVRSGSGREVRIGRNGRLTPDVFGRNVLSGRDMDARDRDGREMDGMEMDGWNSPNTIETSFLDLSDLDD